jgi:NADPH-dependent glutamate synthase beta subunit-like oxidoreductase
MAAWALSRSGRHIAMFESEKDPGGALRDFVSMSNDHAQATRTLVDAIKASGADIKTGVEVPDIKDLLGMVDAIIITY